MHSFNLLSLLFLSFATFIYSAVVTYDWELTWVNANPDGRLERPVIGINGEFPCPTIYVTLGDQLVVNVKNSLGNESTSIHWHGIHQEGTNGMDGPTGATQCPILPGSSFTYEFTVCAMHIML
jgi:iron transport multicopper oxidase